MTVVAAEATWTDEETEFVPKGEGPAVTAVPVPGSVFTETAERRRKG